MELSSIENIKTKFDTKDHGIIYAVTLKPRPCLNVDEGFESLIKYMDKRAIRYWLVKVTSESGFVHYHGLISILLRYEEAEKLKLSLKKKIQSEIGYNYLERVYSMSESYQRSGNIHTACETTSFNNWYEYIARHKILAEYLSWL